MQNQFEPVTMPELRAEVLRLSRIIDYYKAENHHITPKTGLIIAALIESASEDVFCDLNNWESMTETTSNILNDYHDNLSHAKSEIITLCPSLGK